MKINRFLALAVIALMVVGAMGAVSLKGYAQTASPASPQAQVLEDKNTGPDTDNIQEQVGEQVGSQVEDGQPDGAEAPGSEADSSASSALPQGSSSGVAMVNSATGSLTLAKVVSAVSAPKAQVAQTTTGTTETDSDLDEQNPSYSGSIMVDQSTTDGMSEADEAAILANMATITIDQAKTAALAANPGATVIKAELDNENGVLVYSVELSNGSDVKVDAGNAAVLFTDSGLDNEQ
jgi:uncharacterized membrane protein YkoI